MEQKNGLIRKLAINCIDAVKEFPVALFFLTLGVMFFALPGIDRESGRECGTVAFTACLGSLLASLSTTGYKRAARVVAQFVALLLAFLYLLVFEESGCFFSYYADNNLEIESSIASYVFLLICLVFVPFWKRGHDADLSIWSTTMRGLVGAARGALVAFCVFLAMLIITAAGNALLNVDVFGQFWLTFIPLLLFGALSIAAFSIKNTSRLPVFSMASFSKGVFTFIAVPLLAIYLLIFYIYLIEVLASGVTPVRDLSYQAVGVFIAFCAQRYVFQAAIIDGRNTVAMWFNRLSPWLLLLPAFMVTWVVWRRLAQYGITASRLYLVIVNLWMYGVTAWWIITNARRVWVMPVSLALILFLASVLPVNVTSVTVSSMRSRLKAAMEKAGWQLPVSEEFANLNAVDGLSESDRSLKTYLYDEAGAAGLAGLIDMPKRGKKWRGNDVADETYVGWTVKTTVTFDSVPAGCVAVTIEDFKTDNVGYCRDTIRLGLKDAGSVILDTEEIKRLSSVNDIPANAISTVGTTGQIKGACFTYVYISASCVAGEINNAYAYVSGILFIEKDYAGNFLE